MHKVRRFAFLGITFLLAACASQNMRPEDAQAIKRILIAGPENPAQYILVKGDISGAVGMGVAIGAPAAAGVLAGSMHDRQHAHSFTEAMKQQNLALGDELAAALENGLTQSGYDVAKAHPHRRSPAALMESYAGLNAPFDAVLDLAIEHNSYERRAWGKIGPSLTIQARLVDPRTARALMQRTYRYDPYAATIGYTILRPPAEYGFDDIPDVMADPAKAAAGFRAVIPMIVQDVLTQLPRK